MMPPDMLYALLICTTAIALVAIVVLFFVLARYVGLGTIWREILSALPVGLHNFERNYLRMLVDRLGTTPALLVLESKDRKHRNLDLLEAFSPLRLKPDRDDIMVEESEFTEDEPPIDNQLDPPSANLADRLGRLGERSHWSRRRLIAFILLWIFAQFLILAVMIVFDIWLLWSPIANSQFSWLHMIGALAVTATSLYAARRLHVQLIDKDKLGDFLSWWAKLKQCTADPSTPGAEIWSYPRLLIRGHPGSGKTTLLRHLAVICARDLLGQAQRRHVDRVRDVYGWPVRMFPIYIPLRALSLAETQDDMLLIERYAASLPTLFGSKLKRSNPKFFTRRVERGGCLILIDAFDELPDATVRRRFGTLIADLARVQSRKPNHIVVTSRLVGYEGQLDNAGFVRRRIADLDDSQIANFITERYTAIIAAEQRANGRQIDADILKLARHQAKDLIYRLPQHDGLYRLCRNPLLLTLAIAVYNSQIRSKPKLPQARYRLYEEALKLLIEEWEQRKDGEFGMEQSTSEIGRLDVKEKMRLLSELAWSMFERALEDTDRRAHAVIKREQARVVLAEGLRDIGTFATDKQDPDQRLSYCLTVVDSVLYRLNEAGGVLQELGNIPGTNDVQIQFAHLTFQEYLAACAVAEGPKEKQEQRVDRLLARWNDPRWHEVLLVYAASHDPGKVLGYLRSRDNIASKLLAGVILTERPINLAPQDYAETEKELQRIALEGNDVDATSAIIAVRILYQLGDSNRQKLLSALPFASHVEVRTKIISLLSDIECNQAGVPIDRIRKNRRRQFVPIWYKPQYLPVEKELEDRLLFLLEHEQDYRPRVAAGFALSRRDPRYSGDRWMPELVEIPSGSFIMGSSENDMQADNDERPSHNIDIPYTYSIGKTPITVAQWRRFVGDGGYEKEDYWTEAGWRFITKRLEINADRQTILARLFSRSQIRPSSDRWNGPKSGDDNLPVNNISWYESVAYCRWLTKTTGRLYYLPTEAEWEKAARGRNGLIYPWGNDWNINCCNNDEADIMCPSPVGSFLFGASPYGVLDMCGNVYEWCATKYRKAYPYEAEDEWQESVLEGTGARMLRGGSFNDNLKAVRAAYRYYHYPHNRGDDIGFRVASRTASSNSKT